MAWRLRSMFLSGLTSVLLVPVAPARAQGTGEQNVGGPLPVTDPALPDASAPHTLTSLSGHWVYNSDESINVQTGRPEQSPKSATQRTPGGRAGGGAAGVGRGGGAMPGFGRGGAGADAPSLSTGGDTPRPGPSVFAPGEIGPTLSMMQESRSLRRDLMEIPEALNIAVSGASVTFTDDLDRSRSYDITGLKQKYQLGAARFAASTEWKDAQLLKHIEAADGFRMSETYFLSPDGNRLFVIVRLGAPRKGAPAVGVNRVYDRAN